MPPTDRDRDRLGGAKLLVQDIAGAAEAILMSTNHLWDCFRTTAELAAARKAGRASRGSRLTPRHRRFRRGELSGRRSSKKACPEHHSLTPMDSQESGSSSRRTSPEPSSTSGGSAVSIVRGAFAQDRRHIDADLEEGKASLWRRLEESMDNDLAVLSVVGDIAQQALVAELEATQRQKAAVKSPPSRRREDLPELADTTIPLKAIEDWQPIPMPSRPWHRPPAPRPPSYPEPSSRQKLIEALLVSEDEESDSPRQASEATSPSSREAERREEPESQTVGVPMFSQAAPMSEVDTTACPTDSISGVDVRTCLSALSPSSRTETASLGSWQFPRRQANCYAVLAAPAATSSVTGDLEPERNMRLDLEAKASSSSSWRPPHGDQGRDTSWHQDVDVDFIKSLVAWKKSCKLTCMAPGCKHLAVPQDLPLGNYVLRLYGTAHPEHRYCLRCAIHHHQENLGLAWKCWLLGQLLGIELPLAGFHFLLADGTVAVDMESDET
mmetsp:Transcript_63817/g.152205  ORF Transcript_63817/g.152205 Transcript_63817/m.152205 type:complete len:497 (+) Transcript_63817:83-1573(+)